MNELLTENRRLHSQIEKLTDENMNLAAVIRTLRQHLREDNAKLEEVLRETAGDLNRALEICARTSSRESRKSLAQHSGDYY